MNNLGKSGSIITIIGSAFMTLFSLLMLTGAINVNSISTKSHITFMIVFSLIVLLFSITNIVLSSLAIKNNNPTIRIAAGIVAIVSLFFGWIAYFIPAILVLIGGILLLCGKNQTLETKELNNYSNNSSVSDIFINQDTEVEV